MGPAPYFSRPWDDLIDYCGTRFLDGTSSLFFSSMRWQPNRLLRYLISGRDQLPIFLSMRRQLIRLLRYSISGWDQLPIFLVHKTTTFSTIVVLDLRTGHVPNLPRGIPSSMRQQSIDYYSTRSSDGTRSLFPKRNSSSMRRQLIDYYGTRSSDGTSSLFPKRNSSSMMWQIIDYFGNRSTDGTSSLFSKRNSSSMRR